MWARIKGSLFVGYIGGCSSFLATGNFVRSVGWFIAWTITWLIVDIAWNYAERRFDGKERSKNESTEGS